MWMLRERTGSEAESFRSIEDLAKALDLSMQRRMRKAYHAMGSQRFRWDVREKDFDWGHASTAMAVQEAGEWGSLWTTEEARRARFWEWPSEPSTVKCAMNDPSITGLETGEDLSEAERQERSDDLIR